MDTLMSRCAWLYENSMQISLHPCGTCNCFLFDNPIIVSRAVSIASAISSSTNHSCNLKHFPFDSAIFDSSKQSETASQGSGLILCTCLSC